MNKLMFVIPFAGGSSQSFVSWGDLEVFTFIYVDLPGKGKNRDMPLLSSMKDMAVFCADYVSFVLKNEGMKEYYLWGHSMGSYLVYEIAKLLIERDELLPERVILSGTAGPERMQRDEMRWNMLCDERFLDYIVDFGLVNKRVSKSRFFLNMFFPAIKNDYKVLLDYHTEKVMIPRLRAIVINGEDDTITSEDAMQWSEYFEEEIRYMWVPGNHFFVLNGKKIVDEIYEEISGR